MRSYLDCIPCFFRQTLAAARLAGVDEEVQKELLDRLAGKLKDFSLQTTPPEMGKWIYGMIRDEVGNDPYAEIKKESNREALELYPYLKKKIDAASDPLRLAVRLAIAGNIIDYGTPGGFDLRAEIEKVLEEDAGTFQFDVFKEALEKSRRLLYLCDNAGEIVFDRLLIEEIKNHYSVAITAAVRGGPVINDVTEKDAEQSGLTSVCPVISNGYAAPGTVLPFCSKEFRKIYNDADLVISKGQGNFETLWGNPKPIFFLFKIKCSVVARHAGEKVGDTVILGSKTIQTIEEKGGNRSLSG